MAGPHCSNVRDARARKSSSLQEVGLAVLCCIWVINVFDAFSTHVLFCMIEEWKNAVHIECGMLMCAMQAGLLLVSRSTKAVKVRQS
jgi:hypothetical protein